MESIVSDQLFKMWIELLETRRRLLCGIATPNWPLRELGKVVVTDVADPDPWVVELHGSNREPLS